MTDLIVDIQKVPVEIDGCDYYEFGTVNGFVESLNLFFSSNASILDYGQFIRTDYDNITYYDNGWGLEIGSKKYYVCLSIGEENATFREFDTLQEAKEFANQYRDLL
jgi:hypothetical protein